MITHSKTRALAASLRLPNLPSVWSNTLTGVILVCFVFDAGEFHKALPALLVASSLYLAGNLLNDWFDVKWDAQHRPERALPRGLFRPRQYLFSSILLILISLSVATSTSFPALVVAGSLTACILIYSWLHKRTAWATIPMACCRALLPLLGYSMCSASTEKIEWAAVPAALLFVYLIMLTLRARSESREQSRELHTTATTVGLLLPPLMLSAFWYFPNGWSDALLACLAASGPYLAWMALTLTILRKPINRQVSAMLAGIPLVDGLFLMPYIIMGCFLPPDSYTWLIGLLWAPAFILGRLLQRYVPAT